MDPGSGMTRDRPPIQLRLRHHPARRTRNRLLQSEHRPRRGRPLSKISFRTSPGPSGIFGWNVAWMRPITASPSGATTVTGANTRNAGTTDDTDGIRLIVSETSATVTDTKRYER